MHPWGFLASPKRTGPQPVNPKQGSHGASSHAPAALLPPAAPHHRSVWLPSFQPSALPLYEPIMAACALKLVRALEAAAQPLPSGAPRYVDVWQLVVRLACARALLA